jgi:hypothetical protein
MTLANMIERWQVSWAQGHELDDLGPEEREALARDVGLPAQMLPSLIARGPDAAAELPRLMEALSLDVDRVRQVHAALMRDMSIVCSGCTAAVRCRSDLNYGQAASRYAGYCPNAETLQELKGEGNLRNSHP